jgi:hypothetical protein
MSTDIERRRKICYRTIFTFTTKNNSQLTLSFQCLKDVISNNTKWMWWSFPCQSTILRCIDVTTKLQKVPQRHVLFATSIKLPIVTGTPTVCSDLLAALRANIDLFTAWKLNEIIYVQNQTKTTSHYSPIATHTEIQCNSLVHWGFSRTKVNRIGKVYSSEYTDIPKVFTPHHVGPWSRWSEKIVMFWPFLH